jgi:TolB-like protein
MLPLALSNKWEQVVRNSVPADYLLFSKPMTVSFVQLGNKDRLVSNPHDIEQQLHRISSSDEFRNCPQLLRFLRFAVEEALSGRDGGVKERLIGIEVFGRAADYDAGADPVVRVEARRLRRKLTEYYSRDGREDPLEIRLPKGGYLPMFEARSSMMAKRSVAVLPFSGHALGEGLTTRLIARLATCSALRVFRFQNHAGGVELILEGNVRHAGKRFRCDSQLVSSSDSLHLWAGSFDCGDRDAFAVEDEFAGQIVRGVCETFLEEASLQ